MTTSLKPCEVCGRHIRQTERSCPFCFTVLSDDWTEGAASRASRLGSRRAKLFAGALLVSPAIAGGGCVQFDRGTEMVPPAEPATSQEGVVAAIPAEEGDENSPEPTSPVTEGRTNEPAAEAPEEAEETEEGQVDEGAPAPRIRRPQTIYGGPGAWGRMGGPRSPSMRGPKPPSTDE